MQAEELIVHVLGGHRVRRYVQTVVRHGSLDTGQRFRVFLSQFKSIPSLILDQIRLLIECL